MSSQKRTLASRNCLSTGETYILSYLYFCITLIWINNIQKDNSLVFPKSLCSMLNTFMESTFVSICENKFKQIYEFIPN